MLAVRYLSTDVFSVDQININIHTLNRTICTVPLRSQRVRFVLKASCSVQIFQIVSRKAFRQLLSEVFWSFHCHYQNGELTMKPKANSMYLENNFFISYIRTYFCESALSYRLTLNLDYIYKTKHRVFRFKIECTNRSTSKYFYVWVKLRVVSVDCFQENLWIVNHSSFDSFHFMLIRCSEKPM